MASSTTRHWLQWLLIALAVEKIIQHGAVTAAFLTDWNDIRDDVAVDYRWLAVTGLLIGLLFVVAVIGVLRGRSWSLTLLTVLALADIVGEFIAQGTLYITITFSFIVALVILVLARGFARSRTTASG